MGEIINKDLENILAFAYMKCREHFCRKNSRWENNKHCEQIIRKMNDLALKKTLSYIGDF